MICFFFLWFYKNTNPLENQAKNSCERKTISTISLWRCSGKEIRTSNALYHSSVFVTVLFWICRFWDYPTPNGWSGETAELGNGELCGDRGTALPLTVTWTLWLVESWGWTSTLQVYSPSSTSFCTSESFSVPLFSNATWRWLKGSRLEFLYHLME